MKAQYLGNEEFKVVKGNLEIRQFNHDLFGRRIEAKKIDKKNDLVVFCNPNDSEFKELVVFLHNFKVENGYK